MGQNTFKTKYTPCGTRTRNLRIRSPTPCPLGQGGRYYSMEFRRHSTFQHFTFILIAPLRQKHSLIHARALACIMREQSISACIAFAGPSFIRKYSSQRITQIQSPHSWTLASQHYFDIAHHCLLLKHKNTPREAQTPDLEVDSLTLQPTELWKPWCHCHFNKIIHADTLTMTNEATRKSHNIQIFAHSSHPFISKLCNRTLRCHSLFSLVGRAPAQ
jgi:hypothetical protein